MRKPFQAAALTALLVGMSVSAPVASAQERLPWERQPPPQTYPDPGASEQRYANQYDQRVPDSYAPGQSYEPSRQPPPYQRPPPNGARRYEPRQYDSAPRVDTAPEYAPRRYQDDYRRAEPYAPDRYRRDDYEGPVGRDRHTYSQSEIVNAGHSFFGSLSKGLAKAVEYVFRSQGRPTGYILGEDAGGAFIAGLRYGEGRLHTKFGASRKVYWQGPSIGYDFGGEGTRTMVLVYGLYRPHDIFRRFGGVQGSAYLIGGASVQLLTNGPVTLAPIRTGVGLRLGGNVGYLKYTPRPTWNPF
ncbi:MAG: DUF1134 domain-containing protein [Hyphomicrobiaceae bacterium]